MTLRIGQDVIAQTMSQIFLTKRLEEYAYQSHKETAAHCGFAQSVSHSSEPDQQL